MFVSMRPVMIQLAAFRYVEAIEHLKASIDGWHQMEELLLAAHRASPKNKDLQQALEMLAPLQGHLHDALDPLTHHPDPRQPIV